MTVEGNLQPASGFGANRIAERIVEPDRSFTFKVVWVDDKGEVQVNTGYRVQFNNAIGPYKGAVCVSTLGESFDPEIPRFRADFQECADDASDGRRKGGFGLQPQRQVGPRGDALLPSLHGRTVASYRSRNRRSAGDIGVGGREIGYLYGMTAS